MISAISLIFLPEWPQDNNADIC